MKSPLLSLALLFILPALRLLAQDVPPLPAPSATPAKPSAEPAPSLMPEGIDPVGKPDKAKPGWLPKGHSTYQAPKTANDLDLRIRYRQAESRVLEDSALKALWQQSRTARTDYAKRDALRTYYRLMFQKMVAVDKGILPLVQDRERFTMNRLDQTRVEPTDPTAE